jgi:hypothetical protein
MAASTLVGDQGASQIGERLALLAVGTKERVVLEHPKREGEFTRAVPVTGTLQSTARPAMISTGRSTAFAGPRDAGHQDERSKRLRAARRSP